MIDTARSRALTLALTYMAEEQVIAWETLARGALAWMSEADVALFAERELGISLDSKYPAVSRVQ